MATRHIDELNSDAGDGVIDGVRKSFERQNTRLVVGIDVGTGKLVELPIEGGQLVVTDTSGVLNEILETLKNIESHLAYGSGIEVRE